MCETNKPTTTALVKYSDREPVPFSELDANTNLKQPPENWLRGGTFGTEPWIPGSNRNRSAFKSFVMANSSLDSVGQVDLVTESENVKTLLKMPHSKGPLSMIVHRIGRSILLDDAYRHLLRTQEDDWRWIRQFLINQSVESGQLFPLPKATMRSEIEEKLMLSKFLYRSIENPDALDRPLSLEQAEEKEGAILSALQPPMPSVPDPLEAEESSDSNPSVNVHWTFEDIQMLIGTEMPIFGCRKHPCVSLQLRDMKKPISVLTGMDYWLDQLMCNVPEVLMCYHLNGIVQRYEIVKTEELPNIADTPFSPEAVRDMAQNILSFLKSNATKEGHTYWLFKGENDDVVKLYDLSSLCPDYMNDKDANPFTLPVAILMYRVAKNLMQKKAPGNVRKVANTSYRLLNNCLELLSQDKYPQVVGSVHYLLSNLYLAYGSEGGQWTPKEEEETDWTTDDSWQKSTVGEASSAVAVEVLTRKATASPDKSRPSKSKQTTPGRRLPLPNCTNLDDCCKQALEHVYEGLECTEVFLRSKGETADESVPKADPSQAIPLRYEPIRKHDQVLFPLSVRRPQASTWQMELTALLMLRAATAYRMLAECSASLGHCGRALKHNRCGMRCCASVLAVCESIQSAPALDRSKQAALSLLPSFVSHCGTIYLMLSKVPLGETEPERHEQELNNDSKLHFRDRTIAAKAEKFLESFEERLDKKYAWCTERVPSSLHGLLKMVESCFGTALTLLEQNTTGRIFLGSVPAIKVCKEDVTRSLGNAKNELGTLYTNVLQENVKTGSFPEYATEFVHVPEEADSVEFVSQLALTHFQDGVRVFRSCDDNANQALLLSNCARVMRLRAAACAGQHEFSQEERMFTIKAIELYQRGLECVDAKTDNIWELVAKELASVYFTYAMQMQERPPRSCQTVDNIGREVKEYMQKSLRLYEDMCEANRNAPLSHLALARSFEIHYRLASLYQRNLRDKTETDAQNVKRLRALTEMHYNKSVESYDALMAASDNKLQSVSRSLELLRVQLERVAFCEFLAAGIPSSKLKLYKQALAYLAFGCESDLQYLSEHLPDSSLSEDDSSALVAGQKEILDEFATLGRMFLERIQHLSKTMLQICIQNSKKTPKIQDAKESEISLWKKIYSQSILVSVQDLSSFCTALLNLSTILKSSVGSQ